MTLKWKSVLLMSVVFALWWTPTARPDVYTSSHPWIKTWTARDHDLSQSIAVASKIFRVSSDWLWSCNSSEGGTTARETLAQTIRNPWSHGGKGWNTQGSYAFGPWQFMLDRKPPQHSGDWGTFGRYVHAAFSAAKLRNVAVPYRFKRPDSYVGQAITTAYMFSIGQSGQWTGRGC